jgi:putative ABC transport system permease protein
MKYLPLIWYGLWRKRGRTWLASIQICVAFVLFGVLHGFGASVEQMVAQTDADVLMVQSRGGNFELPVSYLEQLARLKGVSAVYHETYMTGKYQDSPREVLVVGTLPKSWSAMAANEVNIPPGAVEALLNDRTGALVGSTFMRVFGWKVGQQIHLQTGVDKTDGTRDWVFDIVGVLETKEPSIRAERSDWITVNYEYLDEARLDHKSKVTQYFVKVTDPRQAAAMADTIDAFFANSSDETRTQSKREMAQSQFQSIGDLNFVIRSITAAVLFALLFSISALLMQGVRERTTELAVLKTVGFKNRTIVGLLLCESLVLCLTAAMIGLGVSRWLLWLGSGSIQGFAIDVPFVLPARTVLTGIAFALTLAVISAILPARRSLRLEIAEALAGR